MIVLTFKLLATCLVLTFCMIPFEEYRGKYKPAMQIFTSFLIVLDMILLFTLVMMGIWL